MNPPRERDKRRGLDPELTPEVIQLMDKVKLFVLSIYGDLTETSLRNAKRVKRILDARDMYCYLMLKYTNVKKRHFAQHLKIEKGAMPQTIERIKKDLAKGEESKFRRAEEKFLGQDIPIKLNLDWDTKQDPNN